MVRLTLRQLYRLTQRRNFGGPSIVDSKTVKNMPGFSVESLKHNYSIVPLLTCFSIGGVVLVWWVYVLMHPAEVTAQDRANEPEGEKLAKGMFGWFYQSNKETKAFAPLSPSVGKK